MTGYLCVAVTVATVRVMHYVMNTVSDNITATRPCGSTVVRFGGVVQGAGIESSHTPIAEQDTRGRFHLSLNTGTK